MDTPDLRHRQIERLTRHGQGHLDPTCAECQHAEGACGRRVAIASDQRLAWFTETLHVNRVADAVSGPAIPDAEALAGRPEEEVLVGVEVVVLDKVVIDVLNGKWNTNSFQFHRLDLKYNENTKNIREKCLIDIERDFRIYCGISGHKARQY